MLLFPVIAWYDIIRSIYLRTTDKLLFPVIAWYDIIGIANPNVISVLLFPVIAWYDIIGNEKSPCLYMFTGILHVKNN